MIKAYSRFCDLLLKVYTCLGVGCFTVIVVASTLQVFTRYVMNSSLLGTEEVARYCFIWATLLGSCICVSRFTHASVNILNDSLKGNLKKIHASLIDVAVLIAAIILFVEGLNMIGIVQTQLSNVLRIPMWVVYLALPVSGFGMAACSIERILERLSEKKEEQI